MEVIVSEMFQYLDKIARCAGEIATQHQRHPVDLKVESKAPQDYVTAADRAVERTIINMIRKDHPDDAVLGEEGGTIQGKSGRVWIIDPIDGTTNYMRSLPWWSISIGVLEGSRPRAGILHGPAMNLTMVAVSGEGVLLNGDPYKLDTTGSEAQIIMTGASPAHTAAGKAEQLSAAVRTQLNGIERRLGCGTASILQVLLGNADLYVGLGEKIWDVCAAAVIADELGLQHSIDWEAPRDREPFDFVCGLPLPFDDVTGKILAPLQPPDRPWQGLYGHRNNG